MDPAESVQGTQLVNDVVFKLLLRALNVSATKTHEVGIAGMCSHPNPELYGQFDGIFHYHGITGVPAASDVC